MTRRISVGKWQTKIKSCVWEWRGTDVEYWVEKTLKIADGTDWKKCLLYEEGHSNVLC